MKKQEYSIERWELFVKETAIEYGPKYTPQLNAWWNNLKPEDDFQPIKFVRKLQAADPEYQENVRLLLDLRKRAHFAA